MNDAGTIVIEITDEERCKMLTTISLINSREHVSQMPMSSLAEESGLKLSKARLVVEDLMQQKLITRYNVSERPIRPRYYYTLSEKAIEFLAAEVSKEE